MASFIDLEDLISSLTNVSLSKSILPSVKVTKNTDVVANILKCLATEDINDYLEVLNTEAPYKLNHMDEASLNYIRIDSSFRLTLNSQRDSWKIKGIHKVLCPYLLTAFLLMVEKKRKYYTTVTNTSVYHGTYARNIQSICENNFNWRLRGTAKGHMFGEGMSFARRSTYACHYPNGCIDRPRTLFLAKVMTAKITGGSKFTTVPPEGCDTTAKANLDVIVKYDDAEYYPQYIIYYHYR